MGNGHGHGRPESQDTAEPRRQLRNRVTWISFGEGDAKSECTVLDVSPGGAKIVTDVAIDVRDRFG
jgi:hypothetical protein